MGKRIFATTFYLFFMLSVAVLGTTGCTGRNSKNSNNTSAKQDGLEDLDDFTLEDNADVAADLGDDFGDEFGPAQGSNQDNDEFDLEAEAKAQDGGDPLLDNNAFDESPQDLAQLDTNTDALGGENDVTNLNDLAAQSLAESENSDSLLTGDESQLFGAATEVETKVTAEKTWVPVKKIAAAPYSKAGFLVNAVYLGRPGDTLSSISQKIFGADREADLLAINPNFNNKPVKVGDKVYYNSPQRPTDDSRLLVFYEDAGLAAETYVTKEGDNVRRVAKNLLGDKDSWKEVWATNFNLESKGDVAAGIEIRYWSDSSLTAMPLQAANESNLPSPPSPSNQNQINEQPSNMNNGALPPEPVAGFDDFDANPATGNVQDLSGNLPPPPPAAPMPSAIENSPPPVAAAPPPPPPPIAKKPDLAAKSAQATVEEPDDLALILGIGGAVIALILIVAMRRKQRQQQTEIDFNTSTTTQIE